MKDYDLKIDREWRLRRSRPSQTQELRQNSSHKNVEKLIQKCLWDQKTIEGAVNPATIFRDGEQHIYIQNFRCQALRRSTNHFHGAWLHGNRFEESDGPGSSFYISVCYNKDSI